MRTKGYVNTKKADICFMQRHIARLEYAGICNNENLKVIKSFPNYADEMVSGLITLKKANILTDENRARISAHPMHALGLARAMVGLHNINLFTSNTWTVLDEYPDMALSFLSCMNFQKNIDVSSYLPSREENTFHSRQK